MKKPKILAIVGPTASGKSALAVDLARKFNGEIVSADSRQIYRGLNIGTGKITVREMKGVQHHMIDIADPRKRYSADLYKKQAEKIIDEMLARGKLPILCGGTGFYLRSIVDGLILPDVQENKKLRASLSRFSPEKLARILAKLDPARAAAVDQRNPVRMIRAIEIAKELGSVPPKIADPKYRTLQLGIRTGKKILREKIEKRLDSRLRAGMIAEARRLHAGGLSWKRMSELGLEYRHLADFLQKRIARNEMRQRLGYEIWHYALRQMAWFRKDKGIIWVRKSDMERAERKIRAFLSKA